MVPLINAPSAFSVFLNGSRMNGSTKIADLDFAHFPFHVQINKEEESQNSQASTLEEFNDNEETFLLDNLFACA